jgi:signal transduction histidine kinase
MRTPLNAIVGFSELAFMGDVDPVEMTEYMQIIRKSSLQLLEKIKDIIFVSTLDADEKPLIIQTVSVKNIFSTIETFYREIDDERNSELTELIFNCPVANDIYLDTDVEKVIHTLKKLIDNALKFTQQGSVEVGCLQPNDNEIEFYVRDTGIGIPSDKFDIIFELFRMGDDSPGRQYGGSGLGLYIAHRLLTLLGATIDLRSDVGTGTRISFTLSNKK